MAATASSRGLTHQRLANLLTDHHLALSISHAAWTELRRQLTYKTACGGREVVVTDRWALTSMT